METTSLASRLLPGGTLRRFLDVVIRMPFAMRCSPVLLANPLDRSNGRRRLSWLTAATFLRWRIVYDSCCSPPISTSNSTFFLIPTDEKKECELRLFFGQNKTKTNIFLPMKLKNNWRPKWLERDQSLTVIYRPIRRLRNKAIELNKDCKVGTKRLYWMCVIF